MSHGMCRLSRLANVERAFDRHVISNGVAGITGSTIQDPQIHSAHPRPELSTATETEAEKIVRELVTQYLRPPEDLSRIFPCF